MRIALRASYLISTPRLERKKSPYMSYYIEAISAVSAFFILTIVLLNLLESNSD